MLKLPHNKSAEEVLAATGSSEHGLANDSIVARLKQYGQNTLPTARRVSLVAIFLRQFLDPLIYVLLMAAQLIHIAAMYIPGLSAVLEISPVSFQQWSFYLAVAISLLLASEVYKWCWRKGFASPVCG